MNTNNQNQTTATTQEVRQPIDRKVVTTEEEKPSVKEKVKEKVHRVGEKVGIVKPETKKIKSKEQNYDDGTKTVQKEVKTTQQDPVPSVTKTQQLTQEREHIHHGGHGKETRKVSSYDPPEDDDENDVVERKEKHREVGVGNTGGYDDKHHEIGVGRTGGNDDKHHEIGVGRTGVIEDKHHELRVGNNDEGYDKHHELRVGHNKDGQNKEHKVELVHHKDPIDKHHEIGVKHQKEEHDVHHHHHHKEGHDKHHEVHGGGHDDRQRVEIDINVVEKPGNFRQRDTGFGNVGLDARQHEIGVGQTGVYDDRQREGGYDAQRDIGLGNVGIDARHHEIGVGQTGVYDDRQREGGQGNYPGGFEAGFGRNGGHNVGVSQQSDGGFHDTNFLHDEERQDLQEDQSLHKPMKKEIRIKEEIKRDGTRIVKTTETISPGAKLETDLTVLHNDLHIGGSNLKEGGNISGQGVGKTHPA